VAKEDPCPEQRLRDFATTIDAGIEQIGVKSTGRFADTLYVKCPPTSTDEACIERARATAIIPEGWEVTGVEIDNNGEMVGVDAKNEGGDRVARLDLLGPPGPTRRVAKLHAMPSGERAAQLEAIHTTAATSAVSILTVAAGPKTIELTVGCSE
jgi:hypothetical protein